MSGARWTPGSKVLAVDDRDPTSVAAAVDAVAPVLVAGGAVVVPTDTVYGVAALPTGAGATDALFALKERARDQALPVLVADTASACALVARPSAALRQVMELHWPGALTLVAARSSFADQLALGGDPATVGLRCPDAALVRALARRVGPLATTSANRHGDPTAVDAPSAASSLAGVVDLVIDGGRRPGTPSTVIDTRSVPWRVLREGGVDAAAVVRLGPEV